MLCNNLVVMAGVQNRRAPTLAQSHLRLNESDDDMSDAIETLMLANLLDVFNERDTAKRQAAIQRTYAPDVAWTDAEETTNGQQALETKCVGLQSNLGKLQFVMDGPVRQVPGFGYLAWRLIDPDSGQRAMSGFDAAIITDGLITHLWTVLIP